MNPVQPAQPAFGQPQEVVAASPDVTQMLLEVQGILNGHSAGNAPGTFGAGIGDFIDFEKAKTIVKTISPFIVAILKTAYPQLPIDQLIDLLTRHVDAAQSPA